MSVLLTVISCLMGKLVAMTIHFIFQIFFFETYFQFNFFILELVIGQSTRVHLTMARVFCSLYNVVIHQVHRVY